jgi:hypothetical protein
VGVNGQQLLVAFQEVNRDLLEQTHSFLVYVRARLVDASCRHDSIPEIQVEAPGWWDLIFVTDSTFTGT